MDELVFLPSATAPAALVEMLTGSADADGLLPPWSQWWDEEEVAVALTASW